MNLKHNDKYDSQKIRNENLEAQRAAAEAISTSRSVLETTMMQGDQIQNISNLHEEQEYMVKRADRLVRGMTWKGWFLNKFTHDVKPPNAPNNPQVEQKNNAQAPMKVSNTLLPPLENLPDELQAAVYVIMNYEGNVKLLEQCDTNTDYMLLSETCNQLKLHARQSLRSHSHHRNSEIVKHLQQSLDKIEVVHADNLNKMDKAKTRPKVSVDQGKSTIFSGRSNSDDQKPSWEKTTNLELQNRMKDQDEHLAILEQSIQELRHNGTAIGSTVEHQNRLLTNVNNGVDTLREDMNMVSRKAERQANRSKWMLPKAKILRKVAIQHVASGKYLSVEPHSGNTLSLHTVFHPEMSTFEIHGRPNSHLIGFKNLCSKTFLGQSFFGAIVCNATRYGRNEEWELDDDSIKNTKLLCACANGGSGGWIEVDDSNNKFAVKGHDRLSKQKATLWEIIVIETIEDS